MSAHGNFLKTKNVGMMRFFVLFSLLITLCVVPCKAQTYALQGMVTDTLKQTVENAVISLSRNDTLVGSCLTDAKGIYLFSEVKAGKYVLSVSHFNYRPLVEAIELNGNKNQTVTQTVTPSKPLIIQ